MMEALLLPIPALLTALLCWGVIKLGIVDAPDGKRKMQSTPVPTAGGLGIIGAFAVLFSLSAIGSEISRSSRGNVLEVFTSFEWWLTPMGVFVIACGLVGLLDDTRGMATRWKFFLIALMALLVAAFSPHIPAIHIYGFDEIVLPVWFAVLGGALWLFVMTNGSNFMDGSNGLAMGSLAIMYLALVYSIDIVEYHRMSGDYFVRYYTLGWIIALIVPGFLYWNLRGKLYAGDTGALFFGALYGGLGLLSSATGIPVWIPVMIALPFLIDILLTMAWRVRHGRNMMHAHRDHAYQLLVRAGWAHWKVALLWWGFAAICGLAAIWCASTVPMVQKGPFEAILNPEDVSAHEAAFGLQCLSAFLALLTIGTALWIWQRVTLGRRLEREAR